jgi:hypothetical protein
VPSEAEEIFRREEREGRAVLDAGEQGRLLMARLRWLKEEDFRNLPDAGDGLGNRLYAAVRSAVCFDDILRAAATRRYPLSRIRRLCLCGALGIPAGAAAGKPPFARILALNERGRSILRDAQERWAHSGSGIPLLGKPAHVRELDGGAQAIFEMGAQAHDFYTLLYPEEGQRLCGEDWRRGPAICS